MATQSISLGPIEDFIQYDDTEFYSDGTTKKGILVPTAPTVNNHVVRKVDLGAVGVDPLADLQFVTMAFSGVTPNERKLTAGNSVIVTDGGANGNATIDTIQDIRTTASPTFAGLTVNSHPPLLGRAAHKDADEIVTNSATLQDDNHLTVNLEASSKYKFKFHLFWTTASATAGIKVALGGTVGVTNLKAQVEMFSNSPALSAAARLTSLGSSANYVVTGDNWIEIEGSIETSTAGTFLLQWAQQVIDGTDGTVVQRNSSLIVTKL